MKEKKEFRYLKCGKEFGKVGEVEELSFEKIKGRIEEYIGGNRR